jgi:predicted nucleic acid-binding protein
MSLVPLVLEYEDVLLRHRTRLGLTHTDIEDLIDAICALTMPHEIHFLWRPHLHDAKDEHVLELAVKARCNSIITFNRKDFAGSDKFGITVLDPGQFLRNLGEIS